MKHAFLAIFALAAALATAADLKIGTVEMMALVRNHPSYDLNRSLLSDTEKDYQKKLDRMRAELDEIQAEGKELADQSKNPMLADAAKTKLENDLVDVQNRYIQAQQKLRNEAMRSQQEMQDLEAKLLKATTDDLRKKINAFASQNGYDFIFDSSATPYFRECYDVTDAVLKSMGVEKRREDDDEGK
ncbi:MAG: OmpH family outer membrane protein [Kiritimatiellae bacterium]|nr:OmpH family outer membrane protein [Kiritimatiellia bacterium]